MREVGDNEYYELRFMKMGNFAYTKWRFHRPTNHTDERHKMADWWNIEKNIGQCERFVWLAVKYLLSFHCTVIYGRSEQFVWLTN